MANNTETPDTTPNNNHNPPDFGFINQHNPVAYVTDVTHKAGFLLLADIFIAQLCTFLSLKADKLYIVRSIMYKPELKTTQNRLQKNKQVHLYIAKYACNFVSKEILLIRKF